MKYESKTAALLAGLLKASHVYSDCTIILAVSPFSLVVTIAQIVFQTTV